MRDRDERPIQEEIQVNGSALMDKVKELIQQGNVRRLIIERPSGKILADVSLTTGIGVAGVLTLLAPMLAALGAMAALVTQFRVRIERDPESVFEDRDDMTRRRRR